MAEYALALYLDSASTERFTAYMQAAADACGSAYMQEPQLIPPHVTVCYFTTDDIAPVKALVDGLAASLTGGEIGWPGLGAFIPGSLYATVTLNAYLADVCARCNALLAPHVTLMDYYRPHQWIPHTTLASKLTAAQLSAAFTAAAAVFTPFSGRAAALSLARCERFQDLHVWNLHHT